MINSFSLNPMNNLFTLFNFQEGSKAVKQKELTHNSNQIKSENENNNALLENQKALEQATIGVFFHHRDVKVALEELNYAGFPLTSLTLMAKNSQRHSWLSGLKILSHFEQEVFNFSQECQQFFHKYFRRGKYILVVQGTEDMLHFAGQVLSRRRQHSKVWYVGKTI